MLEALRGLRDAVAPESGNVGAAHTENSDRDFEDFHQLYNKGDKDTVAMVLKANGGCPSKDESRGDSHLCQD